MATLMRLASCLLLTTVAACSSVKVEHAYGKASFSGFGTRFAWADNTKESAPEVPAEILAFIHDHLKKGLLEKGYTETDAGAGANFLVAFRVSKEFAVGMTSDGDVRHTYEGNLQVHFTKPPSAELMWRGTARAELDASLTPAERRERLQEGITELLGSFPDAGEEAKR